MIGVEKFVNSSLLAGDQLFNYLDFTLLILSTILIAAAGNIINDYFDLKADKVNKPDKLILTKHIKKRWAIFSHWIFNGIAILLVGYLSWKYKNLWLFVLPFISINILWYYSTTLKRKLIIGNVSIAILTALVIILSYIFLSETFIIDEQKRYFIGYISIFAFVQNFAREIIKDAQDIDGDKLINVNSLPMKLGMQKSLVLVSIILSVLPLLIGFQLACSSNIYTLSISKYFPIICAGLINCALILLIYFKRGDSLILYDRLIKISMIFGISSLYYLPLIYEKNSSWFSIAP
jgi:4-hydroxybenzoate polyprenyltransferase